LQLIEMVSVPEFFEVRFHSPNIMQHARIQCIHHKNKICCNVPTVAFLGKGAVLEAIGQKHLIE